MAGGFYPIKAEVDGRTIRGEWTIKQGARICVRAPGYGPAMTVPCGSRKPHRPIGRSDQSARPSASVGADSGGSN